VGEIGPCTDPAAPKRAQRDKAWVLLLGLFAGLFAFTGTTAAAAPAERPVTCADGSSAQHLALPSGATETLCYPASPDAGTAAVDPAISLVKTVGTDESSCALDDAIDVAVGTQVFYCYTVTNTGSVTVSVHDLEDDKLGTLLSGYNVTLGPGATTFATASATIEVDTVNVATWTASDGVTPAQAVASANVSVIDGEVPGAPTIDGVAAAEGEASISWAPPVDDGGSPILGYVVTPYVGANPGTPVAVNGLSTTIDGLANGTAYTFTVAARNLLGTGPESSASAVVTPQWWLPWSSGPVAVTELFTWLTGKAPTSTEKSAWLAQLNDSTKLPGDLVAELRVGLDASKNVDPTVRLYSAYFLRIADPGGLNFWLGRRRGGWTLSRISSSFAGSSEFVNTYGPLSNQDFVELVYDNVLGRPGEPTGVAYWTKQLDTGRKSRGQVMLEFSESNEYRTGQAGNVHAVVIYIHMVGRKPSLVERVAFADDLAAATPLSELVRALIHQPSFANRAG